MYVIYSCNLIQRLFRRFHGISYFMFWVSFLIYFTWIMQILMVLYPKFQLMFFKGDVGCFNKMGRRFVYVCVCLTTLSWDVVLIGWSSFGHLGECNNGVTSLVLMLGVKGLGWDGNALGSKSLHLCWRRLEGAMVKDGYAKSSITCYEIICAVITHGLVKGARACTRSL